MSGHYTLIQEEEMRSFLEQQGFFTEIKLDRTVEIVYSRVVAKNVCLRIFTSVAYGEGRECGTDAIRVALVYRRRDGEIVGIGKDTRVNRIETWQTNLQKRLDNWKELYIICPICAMPMRKRRNKQAKTTFWGCLAYPECKGTRGGRNS